MNSAFTEVEVGLKENGGDKRNVYIYSLTGEKLYPLDPEYSKNNISLNDIAVSLAGTYKFNGLSARPYSMAEHSCHTINTVSALLSSSDRTSGYGKAQILYALFMSADISVFGMRSSLHFNTPAELAQERAEWVGMIWKRFVVDANRHASIPKVDYDLIQGAKNLVLIAERSTLLSIKNDADRIDEVSSNVAPHLEQISEGIRKGSSISDWADRFIAYYHLLSDTI